MILLADTTHHMVGPVEMSSEAIAYINGKRYELPAGRGEVTLLQFLRGERIIPLAIHVGHQPASHALVICFPIAQLP